MFKSLTHTFALDKPSELELINVTVEPSTYRGRSGLRLIEQDLTSSKESTAILPDLNFKDGIIETEVVGIPRTDAPEGMRGFVGIAFRVQPHGSQFECFYLRPTHGRADDQLRRHHATQYVSHPDYPWFKLREEQPGAYESYTDLVAGKWTTIKIVVSGISAQLFVNGAEQPCLIVNDLKLGEIEGQIALWIGAGTEAHFTKILVQRLE
ncbi:MAG TPA: hypothetical protein VFC02_20085 [Anaerolineales bacterium]|nr:hypothetical protein [Anaerolineales bacterium]